ncbi:MAG: helix-turn-helix transcriptional regulator [Hyphomonadaceae bacterium]
MLLSQERFGASRTRLTLAGFLLLIAALLALFVALDEAWILYSAPLGAAADIAALLASALFFDYVAATVSTRRFGPWPYAPAFLYLLLCLALGARPLPASELGPIIAAQIVFTLAALALYVTARLKLPQGWRGRAEHRRLPLLLAGMIALHAAQLARLAAPENALLFDLVPLVGAAGLIALAAYAIVGSQTLRGLAAQPAPPAEALTLAHRIDAAMAESRAYLDPDLSLQKAAALAGLKPAELSAHLNAERGLTFRTYVNRLRIEEAKRLLRAPEEARTSIEAIAAMSGFRSRSSFYAAFNDIAGMTPQEFRAGTLSG